MALPVSKITIGEHLARPWRDLAVTLNAVIDAAGGGGGESTYPRLDVDTDGYIIVDYGEEAQDGDGQTP